MTCINPRQYKIYNVILPKPSAFKFGSTTILSDIGGPSSSSTLASSSSSSLLTSSAAATATATSSAGTSSSSGFYINSQYDSNKTHAATTTFNRNNNNNTILNITDKSIKPINGIQQNRVNFVYPPSVENTTKLFTTISQLSASSSSSATSSSSASSTSSSSTSSSSALLQKLQQQRREKQLQSTEKRSFRYKTTSNDSISCEIKIFKPIHTPAIRKVPKVVLRVPTKKVYPLLPPGSSNTTTTTTPRPYKCKPQKNKKCTFRPNLRGKNRYSAFCVVPSAITVTKSTINSNKNITNANNNGINLNGINEKISSSQSTDLLNNFNNVVINKRKKPTSSSSSSSVSSSRSTTTNNKTTAANIHSTLTSQPLDLQSIEQNPITKNGYFLRSKRKLHNNSATINKLNDNRRLSSTPVIKSAIEETNANALLTNDHKKNVNKRQKQNGSGVGRNTNNNGAPPPDVPKRTLSSKRVSSKKVKK